MNTPDQVCKHGVAMDVHCCNCHSGFLFDKDHECPEPDEEPAGMKGQMHDASDEALDRWARRYDELNGAPDNEEDR